jgi:hypothetical protein
MVILGRLVLLVIAIPIAFLFLGTALIWFAWVFSRSNNGW